MKIALGQFWHSLAILLAAFEFAANTLLSLFKATNHMAKGVEESALLDRIKDRKALEESLGVTYEQAIAQAKD